MKNKIFCILPKFELAMLRNEGRIFKSTTKSAKEISL
jgi:hypothetical protein